MYSAPYRFFHFYPPYDNLYANPATRSSSLPRSGMTWNIFKVLGTENSYNDFYKIGGSCGQQSRCHWELDFIKIVWDFSNLFLLRQSKTLGKIEINWFLKFCQEHSLKNSTFYHCKRNIAWIVIFGFKNYNW